MKRVALTISLLLCTAPAVADILFEYRLEAEDLNGNPINSIAVGQDFQLAAFVDDLRNPPALHGGVFAGFLDVAYAPLATIPAGETTVKHSPLMIHGVLSHGFFTLVPSGDLSTPGQIFGGGAAATSLRAPGAAEQALWTLTMHGASEGLEQFTSSFDPRSGHDSLLYDLNPTVTIDQIVFVNTTLEIVPEPSSFVLAAVGLLAVVAWTWRRRKV